MNRHAAIATVLLVVHHVISYVHGEAHARLGVDLEPWQWAYVYSVIFVAPIVGTTLYWTRWRQAGALVFGASMLGSLLFGVYFHFIAVTHDNVRHLPAGDAQGLFIATAIALVPVEALGTVFGFWTWARGREKAI